MAELNPASSAAQVRAHLQLIAGVLRAVDHLGRDGQRALADLVDELSRALEVETVPSAELAHLADSASHLLQAVGRGDEPGPLGRARDRLAAAVAAVEAEAPVTAGVAHRLVDLLSSLGI